MKSLFAVLIAIDNYHNERYDLEGCVNDLNALHTFLTENFNTPTIKTLTNKEATRDNIIQSFRHFDQAEDGDVCLLYYSGHGSKVKAPKEFMHEEPDGMLRSIVCHASRDEGGKDLLNKEISYLIWKAISNKNIHFTTIMDCCFAGSNTRGEKVRMYNPRHTPHPIEEFHGLAHYKTGEDGILNAPIARHISLSACKKRETAKEVYKEGAVRGAFTYSLLQALKRRGTTIRYNTLMKEVNIQVNQVVDDQSPQYGFTDTEDAQAFFLGASGTPVKETFLVYYDKKTDNVDDWVVNQGSIHGITKGDTDFPTTFKLKDGHTIRIKEVFLTYSKVEGMDQYKKGDKYDAELVNLAIEKVKIGIGADMNPSFKARLIELLNRRPSDLFEIIPEEKEASYILRLVRNGIGLSYKNDQRLLFLTKASNNDQEVIVDLINRIETISKWGNLLDLHSPHLSFPESAFSVEVFRTTEPGNYNNSVGKELHSFDQPLELSYLFNGEQWEKPALQVMVRNNTTVPLWFSVIYMGDRFEIEPILSGEELRKGEQKWVTLKINNFDYRTLRVQLDDEYLNQGLTHIQEHLKFIISTQELNTSEFQQPPLPWDGFLSKYRSFDRHRAEIVPEAGDWTTKRLGLKIKKPLGLNTLDTPILGTYIKLPESGTGKWTLFTFTDGLPPSIHDYTVDDQPGQLFMPYEFIPGIRNNKGLSVVGIYPDQSLTQINREHPIQITFKEQPRSAVVPFAYNNATNDLQSLAHDWKGKQLFIYDLPFSNTPFFKELGSGHLIFLGEV